MLTPKDAVACDTEPGSILLFATPVDLEPENREFLSKPDTGYGRILESGRFEGVVSMRGGGAYYSFATKSNSYDREPDLCLAQGQLSSGFYGGSSGFVVNLGGVDFEDLCTTESRAPAFLQEKERTVWESLWQDVGHPRSKEDRQQRRLSRETTRSLARQFQDYDSRWSRARSAERAKSGGRQKMPKRREAQLGSCYLIRAILPEEHDHLVAMKITHKDDFGIFFIWKILKAWDVAEKRRPHSEEPHPSWDGIIASDLRSELEAFELKDLIVEKKAIQRQLDRRLLTADAGLTKQYESFIKRPRSGITRLLNRGHFNGIVSVREGGAYFSFLTRSHSSGSASNIAFENGKLSKNDVGLIVDLGNIDINKLNVGSAKVPQELSGGKGELWQKCWRDPKQFAAKTSGRESARWIWDERETAVSPIVGHCYLMRTMENRSHDFVVVLKILAVEEDQVTFIWRILKSWPAPLNKR